MSYLIDALKKAERDRHARREANLRTAAATNAPARKRPAASLLVAVVAVLVLVNTVLLFRLWTPADQNAAGQAAPSQADPGDQPGSDEKSGSKTAQHIVARRSREQRSSGGPDSSASTQASSSTASNQRSHGDMSDKRKLGSLRLSPAPPTADAPDTRAAVPSRDWSQSRDDGTDHRPAAAQSAGAGSVRYADTRLSDDEASPTSEPVQDNPGMIKSDSDENLPNQAQVTGAPQIEINGQLYSSVPGRSFILVDGRRYHDGEKLPMGPAIERITPSGAILRYRSKRYHVSGPGGG